MAISFLSSQSIDGLLNVTGKATFEGKVSVGGGDTSTAQMALKGQQSLLSFIRGTAGDAQFFMSSDSARLYFSHTDAQSGNLILTLNQDESATFAGNVGIGIKPDNALLQIKGAGDAVRVESTNAGAGGAQVDLLHFTPSPADNDVFAVINMGGYINTSSPQTSIYGSQIKSTWIDNAAKKSKLEFTTCASTLSTVLTLDSQKNATFTGSILATNSSAVIQTPKISMEADGTLDWGAARDYGTLTWSGGYAFMVGQTGKGLIFKTDVSTTNLTLDTSGNATFAGIVQTDKIFVATGQNLSHTTSSIKISQESTTKSQIRFYGEDSSTAGILEFTGSTSDGSAGGTRLTINADGSSTFTGLVSGITPTAAANFTTKAYVDSVSGGTVGGTGTAGKVAQWSTGGADIEDGPITFSGNNSTFAGTITSGVLSVGTSGTSRFTDTNAIPLQLNRGLAVDVVGTNGVVLGLGSYTTGTTYVDAARIAANLEYDGTTASGDLFLQVNNSGTYTNALTINNDTNATFVKDVTIDGVLDVKGASIELNGNWIIQGTDGSYFQRIKTVDSSATSAETFSFEVKLGAAASYKKLLVLNQDDTATFSGKAIAGTATVSGDDISTLATKGYVDTLVSGAVKYIGTWSAADNGSTTGGTPDLTDATLEVIGNYYICEVAGTAEPNGTGTEPDTWAVGDWVIYSDLTTDAWQKIDNSTVLSGAGVANQVARWTDTETLSGGTGFTYAGGATGAIAMGGTLSVDGALTLGTITNATADPDKFLCASSGGTVGYRTGTQVRSDIGAGTGDGNVTTSGLTAGRVSFATSGTNIEDQGNFTYNNSTQTLDVNGLIQGAALSSENTRVSTSQQFPVGHYSSGEVVWEMDTTWSNKQLQDYFDSSGVSWVEVADAPGGWCIYLNGGVNVGGAYNSGFPFIPVETDSADGDYYMECYIQNVGSNQTHYMGSTDFDENFDSLGGNPGSYGYWVMSNTNPGQSWTKVTGYIGGFHASQTGRFELGTKYWTPQALFNYGAGTGTRACRISGWKVIKTQRSTGIYKFPGSVRLPNASNALTDTDKFAVLDVNNAIRFRTGAQVLSDIGGAPSTGGDYLPLAGGTLTGNLSITKASTPELILTDTTNNVNLLIAADDANTFLRSSSGAPMLFQTNAGTTALTLDSSQNATFAGKLDVGTLTLSASAIVADVGMTLEVDSGNVNAITIDNVGTVTFGYYTYFPNYLFHEGDTNTRIQFGTGTITLRGDSGITLDGNVSVDGTTISSGFVTGKVGFGINYVGGATVPMVILANATDYGIFYREATPDHIEFQHGGTVRQSFDGNGNVSFTGGLTATTGTFSGDVTASTAGINTILSVGTGATGTLRLQDSGTSYLTMYKSSGVAFIQGAATGNTIFFGAPASFVQNINVQGTVDVDNFKVNGAQGSSGQVLTSSGSGVSWQTPSGGGSGTIGGSGTAGFVPRFSAGTTLGNTNIQNDGTNTTINTDNAIFQITKPSNASDEPTFYVDTDENRVGFRTTSPNAAFDVNGTIKTLGFNANEQQFFVDPDNKYIKAGAYGSGEFFGVTGANNQPKYTFAAGNEGKFVEDERIETIAISGSGFDDLNSVGTTVIPAPGANSALFIKSITVYKGAGTPGTGWSSLLGFGFCDSGTTNACNMAGGQRSWRPWAYFPATFVSSVIAATGTWFWQSERPVGIGAMASSGADKSTFLNRGLILRNASDLTALPTATWYVQIKYSIINVTAGFTNNVDRTITGSGQTPAGRTAFNAANGTVFNGVCTSTPGNPNANTFYFVNTSGNAQQSYPCNGDTVYTTQTGTTLLPSFYYYLYSAGGSRFYIQVINGIVSNQSGCSVNTCSPPI
tara:strand:- start:2391 stop:7937 length:5547 start_codon:yes stop_codon:yes gene_type:complete